MDTLDKINEQIKETVSLVKDRYINPFAIILISYILVHNWQFFYTLLSDDQISLLQRFELADKFWKVRSGKEISMVILCVFGLLTLGLVLSTASKAITDLWNKIVKNWIIVLIDKKEYATQGSLSSWKKECKKLEDELKSSSEINDKQLKTIEIIRENKEITEKKLKEARLENNKLTTRIDDNPITSIYFRYFDLDRDLSSDISTARALFTKVGHNPFYNADKSEYYSFITYMDELFILDAERNQFVKGANEIITALEKIVLFDQPLQKIVETINSTDPTNH